MKSVSNQVVTPPPLARHDWPFRCLRYYCRKNLSIPLELASIENKKIFSMVMLEFDYTPTYIAERLYMGRSTVYKAKQEHDVMMKVYWYKARYEACKNYVFNFPHNYNKAAVIKANREAEQRRVIEREKQKKILR